MGGPAGAADIMDHERCDECLDIPDLNIGPSHPKGITPAAKRVRVCSFVRTPEVDPPVCPMVSMFVSGLGLGGGEDEASTRVYKNCSVSGNNESAKNGGVSQPAQTSID